MCDISYRQQYLHGAPSLKLTHCSHLAYTPSSFGLDYVHTLNYT